MIGDDRVDVYLQQARTGQANPIMKQHITKLIGLLLLFTPCPPWRITRLPGDPFPARSAEPLTPIGNVPSNWRGSPLRACMTTIFLPPRQSSAKRWQSCRTKRSGTLTWHVFSSRVGQADAAMGCLERATEYGFTDFTILQNASDFTPLHAMPRYKQLIARKDEIRHNAAQRAMDELRARFGNSYLIEADEEQKLIFATNTDRATLDALKTWLHDQEISQCAGPFRA